MKNIDKSLLIQDVSGIDPLFHKLSSVHQENLMKQRKAQAANHNFISQYQKNKQNYQAQVKQKENAMLGRLNGQRKSKIKEMRQKSAHVQKVLEKFHKVQEENLKKRVKVFKQQYFNGNASYHHNSMITDNSQSYKRSVSNRKTSNSIDLASFYRKNEDSERMESQSIMQKTLQKLKKAEMNKQSLNQVSRIKAINESKIYKKIKAQEQELSRSRQLLKKSIIKLKSTSKRIQESQSSLRKKSIQRRQRQKKNLQKVKRKRQRLQTEIQQKINKQSKVQLQKQNKTIENKEALKEKTIEVKKHKRLWQAAENEIRYNRSLCELKQKMDSQYQKDREQWNFLTNISQCRQVLKCKNIYQSNQLSLLK